MTKAELVAEWIANGENSGVEFKRDDDLRPEQLAKEVVALANFRGGRILIGVDDDGAVGGIQRGDIYIRIGSISRLATREQQARPHSLGGMLFSEKLPVSGSGLPDLSLDRLKHYLSTDWHPHPRAR